MTKILRYDARRDSNEAEIVEALRAVGAGVIRLDEFDLLVAFRGNYYAFEVKTPEGELSDKQLKFINEWPGSIYIVRSADEALRYIGAID